MRQDVTPPMYAEINKARLIPSFAECLILAPEREVLGCPLLRPLPKGELI
jgi:hypothetical protein